MRWWQRLEVRVLLLSTLLPLFGIVSVSFGVLHLMRQGLLDGGPAAVRIDGRDHHPQRRARDEGRPRRHHPRPRRGSAQPLGHRGRRRAQRRRPRGLHQGHGRPRERGPRHDCGRTPCPSPCSAGSGCSSTGRCSTARTAAPVTGTTKSLLGATKVSIPLREVFQGGSSLVAVALAWSLAGVLAMGLMLWWLIRMLVVRPVARMREATAGAGGRRPDRRPAGHAPAATSACSGKACATRSGRWGPSSCASTRFPAASPRSPRRPRRSPPPSWTPRPSRPTPSRRSPRR